MGETTAIGQLEALSDASKAVDMAAYHKVSRRYLGVSNPQIDVLCKEWRKLSDPIRLETAHSLWKSQVHEGMVAAAKILSRGGVSSDKGRWLELRTWIDDFDAWAVADHACKAISICVVDNPDRLNEVEGWTKSPSMWIRRAAMVSTLPWARIKNPNKQEEEIRERVLGWASVYVEDQEWFIQKSVSWWLRELSKHDPEKVRVFLSLYASSMKAFARKDASKFI